MRRTSQIGSFLSSELGAAIVEFAIVLPLLLLLVFGIADFGRALFIKNNLTSAARSGARVAAVQLDPITTSKGTVDNAVKWNAATFGSDTVSSAMITVTAD